MKKIAILLILLVGFTVWYYLGHPLNTRVIINGQAINVEVAVTVQEKQRGLGYRETLPENSGMLFVYDHPEKYSFWMKDMRFPLDFIWINGVTVVDLTENVPAPTVEPNLSVYQPRVPVDKILEVNAGLVKKYGIQIGDTVKITD